MVAACSMVHSKAAAEEPLYYFFSYYVGVCERLCC